MDFVEVFNSDNSKFGGSSQTNEGIISPILEIWNSQPYCINISVLALSIIFIKPNKDRQVQFIKT